MVFEVKEGNSLVALGIGAAVAAVSVAIVSYFYMHRLHRMASEAPPLRNVSEVLTDCYDKVRELQQTLAEWHPSTFQPSATQG